MDNSEDFNFEQKFTDLFQIDGQLATFSINHDDNFNLRFDTTEEDKSLQAGLNFRDENSLRSISEFAAHSNMTDNLPIKK